MKKWSILKADPDSADNITKKSNLSRLCAEILAGRGFDTIKKASDFFGCRSLSDPFLLKDMDKAVETINSAVENQELICIYGDYDCDGIMSTVILYSYLQYSGADIIYYIPERCEGYGMNEKAVRFLKEQGVSLIITVDNGISAYNEITLAKELGMKVVVTDHHTVPDILPPADAVVDPKQNDCFSPFKKLCGAGVALKLAAALDGGDYSAVCEQFSDLAGIATIADIVELSGENRLIASDCLHYIQNTENPGLSALISASGLDQSDITSTDIAFMIAPRINASGRFGSPRTAVELFLCDDEDRAAELAAELCTLNQQRKNCENEIMSEIEQIITECPSVLNERVLVFAKEGWHCGVIGIISAKITERFGKPSFIISIGETESRGSARGIEGYSVYDALYSVSSVLTHFGGHTGAGGFSLSTENIRNFIEGLLGHARTVYLNMPIKTECADKLLSPSDLTLENITSLSALEPFGEGNKRPLFAIVGAKATEIIPLSNGKHTKIKINYSGILLDVLFFGKKTESIGINTGDCIDLLVTLEINKYNGRTSISAKAADYRYHGINQAKYFSAKEIYESYKRSENIMQPLYERMLPSREELLTVYKCVNRNGIAFDSLLFKISLNSMNFCKLRICLDILEELELITYDRITENIMPGEFKKVDLDSSLTLSDLKIKCG